jgi:DNA-directed RNA polymerase
MHVPLRTRLPYTHTHTHAYTPVAVAQTSQALAEKAAQAAAAKAVQRGHAAAARAVAKNRDLHSLRSDLLIKLGIADQFVGRDMYFPHNLDFRGRAYPIPPNLNHMGNDFTRGVLRFAEAKPLGPRGLYWLKVQVYCTINCVSNSVLHE